MPASIITSMMPAVKRPRMAPPSSTKPFFIVGAKVVFFIKNEERNNQLYRKNHGLFGGFDDSL
jgi:hypothetical protein